MSRQFDAPAKIPHGCDAYSDLSYKQRGCYSVGRLWNAAVNDEGKRYLRECPPPRRLSDIEDTVEMADETQRYLNYLRAQGLLTKTTIAGREIDWAPTPKGQQLLEDVLEHTDKHVPTDAPICLLYDDINRSDISLLGDTPTSLAHRYMVSRMFGFAKEAGWAYGLYAPENGVADLRLQPDGLRVLAIEAWAENNNQEKWYNSWQELRDLEDPVIHVFGSVEILRELQVRPVV